MMCACDEPFGRRFLAHQLDQGTELTTQRRVPVTHGFQPAICAECRGLAAASAPVAEIHGRTSKIKRYYWRELFFEETRRKADWDEAHPEAPAQDVAAAHAAIGKAVLDGIKRRHAEDPKYLINEPSQAQILERCGVTPVSVIAAYAEGGTKGAMILDAGEAISPEEFVSRHFRAQGWSVMALESVPFHALFGVLMWMLIQDPADPQGHVSQFGARDDFEARRAGRVITMKLPSDFGTTGYAERRRHAVQQHFKSLAGGREELLFLFDYWRAYSEDLRQYLWAHRSQDVDRARQLVELLPPDTLREILLYLVEGYWERFLGWPDLILHRGDAFRFVEVKSSSDKLSGDQKRWIIDNHDRLRLPFDLVKIHRPSGQGGKE